MKKTGLLIGLLVCSLVMVSCFSITPQDRPLPVCAKAVALQGRSAAGAAYQPMAGDTCVAYLTPFDQAGWYESVLNSRRVRGESTVRLGCTHCPAGNRDCKSPNNCQGCGTASLYFDFTRVQEDAEIVAAYLAVYVVDNMDLMSKAIVEGRVNVGGDFQVIADRGLARGNWVLYDITPFVCRNVSERRNSASIDMSLPCGPEGRTGLATMALAEELQPAVIIELR